ncbi:MAG: ABC transporter ATP-binding protein [Chitinophagaceae bacterium]|nr:ABC transporter ATP-binding protein [Chitinophagaceae bacterium]
MAAIIHVKDLSKAFGEITAVSGLSFQVPEGQVYGFLGQNGAGKSTTIRMLLTLVTPSSGSIEIFGLDLFKHRKEILRQVGAIIERPDLYKYLTAYENLKLFATMSGVRATRQKILEQLTMVGLQDRADSKVKTFSQGMKQRLGIATALIHDPRLIILDEPTNGLDPQGIADVRNLILHLSREKGKTLVISSHLLSEMELIADSMLIIDKGKKVVEGLSKELLNPDTLHVELITGDKQRTLAVLKESEWKSNILDSKDESILVMMPAASVPMLNRLLVEKGVHVFSIRPKNSLEDYFLSLTRN